MNKGVLAILIGIIFLLGFIVYNKVGEKKMKKSKKPEKLAYYLRSFINLINNTELSTIFSIISNDGEFLIFKEKTLSRNLFIVLSYDQIYISLRDEVGVEIERFNSNRKVVFDLYDDIWIDTLHELYLQTFNYHK